LTTTRRNINLNLFEDIEKGKKKKNTFEKKPVHVVDKGIKH
jgi:hypothetical protein